MGRKEDKKKEKEKEDKDKKEKEEEEKKKKAKEEEEQKKKDEEAKLTPRERATRDLRNNIALLNRAVAQKDASLVTRVLRQNVVLRRQLRHNILVSIAKPYAHALEAQPFKYLAPVLNRLLIEDADLDRIEAERRAKEKAEADRVEAERKAKELAKEKAKEKDKAEKAEKAGGKKADDKDGKDSNKKEATKMDLEEAELLQKKEQEKKQAKEAEELKKRERDEADKKKREEELEKKIEGPVAPEVQAYVHLLVLIYLLDRKALPEALACSIGLVEYLGKHNRRSLDLLSARAWYYYVLTHERSHKAAAVRSQLLLAYRTACLRHDEPSQAVLTNAILRNYIAANLYSQADKFRLNSHFPAQQSSSQHARYLYYIGKIETVQLRYSDAYNSLSQAQRKAPTAGAVGFRQAVNKLLVIVQLLMGDIPERSLFRQAALARSLKPYFQLTQAVRVGNLAAFQTCVTTHEAIFVKDKMLSLIARLRHNVIKTGLRRINVSYSRVSIRDIVAKLHLDDGLEDAEAIVAKAIADGVIEATIDRKAHFVFSKENTDVYSTSEPQQAFHKRIQFCLDLYNQAVKDMRFPPDAHKPKAELLNAGDDLAAELAEEENADGGKDD